LDKSNSEAYKYIGIINGKLEKKRKAIEAYIHALMFTPNNSEIWKLLALAYHVNGDDSDALIAWQQAIKYAPYQISLYLQLAKLQLDLESPEAVKITLDQALKLDPNNVMALKLLFIALNDPVFDINNERSEKIKKLRQEIYNRLHALAPAEAEEIKARFNQNED
jgi:tetratricopeptide (TPR) repeat protein